MGGVRNEEMGTGERGHGKEKFIDYVIVQLDDRLL